MRGIDFDRNSRLGWEPPGDWLRLVTIDAHTAGEPLRVVVAGWPELRGKTILDRRRYCRETLDHLRTALMWEPRGHADMYGCLLTPPVSAEADFGVLFLNNEGYSTMCGHGIIGVATVAVECGLIVKQEPVTKMTIDTPAGAVTAEVRTEGGKVSGVTFRNVPSFVVALDQSVEVPELGRVRYDLAFGGAFYAFVNADETGVSCSPEDVSRLIERGMAIKRAIAASRPIEHPLDEALGFLFGTIFVGTPQRPKSHSRNVCIFADGEVDRSPCGTGVSARAAIHLERGEIGIGQALVIESVIGSRLSVRVVERTILGPYQAVISEVEGRAFVTGRHEFLLDPADPHKDGFILR